VYSAKDLYNDFVIQQSRFLSSQYASFTMAKHCDLGGTMAVEMDKISIVIIIQFIDFFFTDLKT